MNKLKKYIKISILITVLFTTLIFFTVGLLTMDLLFLIPSVFCGSICIQFLFNDVIDNGGDNNE